MSLSFLSTLQRFSHTQSPCSDHLEIWEVAPRESSFIFSHLGSEQDLDIVAEWDDPTVAKHFGLSPVDCKLKEIWMQRTAFENRGSVDLTLTMAFDAGCRIFRKVCAKERVPITEEDREDRNTSPFIENIFAVGNVTEGKWMVESGGHSSEVDFREGIERIRGFARGNIAKPYIACEESLSPVGRSDLLCNYIHLCFKDAPEEGDSSAATLRRIVIT